MVTHWVLAKLTVSLSRLRRRHFKRTNKNAKSEIIKAPFVRITTWGGGGGGGGE